MDGRYGAPRRPGSNRRLRTILFMAAAVVSSVAWAAAGSDGNNGGTGLDLYADFRFRAENDWDSLRVDGTMRPNRDRYRIRLRAGLDFAVADSWHFGARLRTGNNASQQSPHITILDNDNPEGDADLVADRWFASWQRSGVAVWGGRNTFSFWKQNEMFWDDDVTPLGAHIEITNNGLPPGLTLNAGAFTLPDGMKRFNGALYAGQAVYSGARRQDHFNIAAGFFRFDGELGARHLLDGNGERNYSIWNLSGNYQHPFFSRPLTMGIDYYHNSADNAARNERDGYVLSLLWGGLKNPGDWHAGYSFARLERLSVNASFAQDDWLRFGTATQTRSSDFRGQEIRLGYAVTGHFNLLARFYTVESLSSVEDGLRFRLDFNFALPF